MCKKAKPKNLTPEKVEQNRETLCENLSKQKIEVKTSDGSSFQDQDDNSIIEGIFSGKTYYQKDKGFNGAKFYFALEEKFVAPLKGGQRKYGKVLLSCIVPKDKLQRTSKLLEDCGLSPLK